jgi:protein subunit release factor A
MEIRNEDCEVRLGNVHCEIPKDLGGQQCGLPNYGVFVKHIPTGFSAHSSWHRSQLKNRRAAMQMIEWAIANIE